MLDIERQVADSLVRAGLSLAGSTLVVACSGGPDSTALLRCLHRLRERHGLTLHVAHLNHDFRGAEADHDAAFVQQLSDRLGLPCSIDKRDPIAYQRARGVSSFEQAAREMRYSFLRSVAEQAGASAVALGHTGDDQAETVMMHLLRGSGLQGLRGMSETAAWPWPEPGPMLFRPLLGARKDDAAAYCRELGQSFRTDSGNFMWRFRRNRVRLELMPRLARQFNPRVSEALSRLSRAASDNVDFIEGQLDQLWPGICDIDRGSLSLDAVALSRLHSALQRHAVRRAFSLVAGDVRGLNEGHIEAIMSLVQRRAGGRSLHLPRGVRAQLQSDVLTLALANESRPFPALQGDHTVQLPRGGNALELEIDGWFLSLCVIDSGAGPCLASADGRGLAAAFEQQVLGSEITVRSRRPGDRFQPSGMAGTRKLQDFFTDAKVPREQRDSVPLLVCHRGIAWVVGHRVADWALPSVDAPAVIARFSPKERG